MLPTVPIKSIADLRRNIGQQEGLVHSFLRYMVTSTYVSQHLGRQQC